MAAFVSLSIIFSNCFPIFVLFYFILCDFLKSVFCVSQCVFTCFVAFKVAHLSNNGFTFFSFHLQTHYICAVSSFCLLFLVVCFGFWRLLQTILLPAFVLFPMFIFITFYI